MTAVGVEGDERERLLGGPVARDLALVLDDDGPSRERGGQGDDESADHAVGPLRILVLLEELTRPVDQQAVQLRRQVLPGCEAEVGAKRGEHRLEGPLPAPAVELDLARGDLASVAHAAVEQGAIAPPVASRPRFGEQQPCLLPRNREAQRPHTPDLENEVVGWRCPPGGERACTDTAQQASDLLAGGRVHSGVPEPRCIGVGVMRRPSASIGDGRHQ